MRKIFIIVACLAGALALGFGYYFLGGSAAPEIQGGGARAEAPARIPPAGWHEYRSERYILSLFYPENIRVEEYDEGGGATTITFQDTSSGQGFQIFIVPYNESLITEERFYADVPSGVRENVEDTTLDGVRAVTFNSLDERLGETREIWVIRNGYLYEITTFKGVGTWFALIIQSWRFLL